MKTTVVILAGGLAAMVTAQEGISDCARSCLSDMVGQANDLGCADAGSGDALIRCLCTRVDYAYGIHDCSIESCSSQESLQLVTYAQAECERVGINWHTVGDNLPGTGAAPEASGTVSGTGTDAAETVASGIADVTSALEETPISGVVATITSNGQVLTTTLPAADVSTIASDIISQTGSATTTGTAGGDATESGNGATPSPSGTEGEGEGEGADDGSAAKRVMAPLAGFVIAAGIAAFLL